MIEYQLSNDELAKAIAETQNLIRHTARKEERYDGLNKHFDALLDCQLLRAKMTNVKASVKGTGER